MRARIVRFSAALASHQMAISAMLRKQPRHCREPGSIRQIPMQGEGGAGSPSPGGAIPQEPLGASSRSASFVRIILAL